MSRARVDTRINGRPHLVAGSAAPVSDETASKEKASAPPSVANRQAPPTPLKGPDAAPAQAKSPASMAQQLQRAYIDMSLKHSSIPFRLDAGEAHASDDVSLTPRDKLPGSGQRTKIQNSEYPSSDSKRVDSPRRSLKEESRPSGLAAGEKSSPIKKVAIVSAKPVESPVQPSSPRKAIRAVSEKVKSKVEDLTSPKAATRHLFDDMEWTVLTKSYVPDPDGNPFRPPVPGSESPTASPPSSRKRKADEDAELPDTKRVRFDDEDYSRAMSESSEPELAFPPSRHREQIEQLANALGAPLPGKKQVQADGHHLREIDGLRKKFARPAVVPGLQLKRPAPLSETGDAGTYPFEPAGHGIAILEARSRGKAWFDPSGRNAGSTKLRHTLKLLQETNQGKINSVACASLHELFALLPAGALMHSEVFRTGLHRAVRETPLTDAQWKTIEILDDQFTRLDTSGDPEACEAFGDMLEKIIALKKEIVQNRPASTDS